MSVKPIRDNVLVKRSVDEFRSPGGIVVVQNEKSSEGTVVAVGDGIVTMNGTIMPLAVSVGDKVVLRRGAGSEFKSDGEEFLLVAERDILAIVS